MAIDTETRRRAAMNLKCPWRRNYPVPDGTIAQADRQHYALYYGGILADVPTVAAELPPLGPAYLLRWSEPVHLLRQAEPALHLRWSEPGHNLRSVKQ